MNYYTDHPEIAFHLNSPLMKRIVELKERDYADKDKYADAPVNFEDAIENYKRLLEITGDVAANIIEPNSEAVDLEARTSSTDACSMRRKPTRTWMPHARLDCGEYPCHVSSAD